MHARIALTSLAFLAACGPGNSLSGTVAGTGFTIKEAIIGPVKSSSKGSGLTTTAAGLILSDTAGWCDALKANRMKKNTRSMVILLTNRPDQSTQLAPAAGDFTVTQQSSALGNLASAQVLDLDGTCTRSSDPDARLATSGLVKLTQLKLEANGTASGELDLTFGPQKDKVTGTFNATYCEFPPTAGSPSCE
ncbi:MAG: hypothetical protein K1X89_08400 [Myxococcaceae bacterium]|nr:hypothetical protein [Myxococcaceae bacterium]